MSEKCDFNRDHLLALYFKESTERDAEKAREHVSACPECRKYLMEIKEADRSLQCWPDAFPRTNTMDVILSRIVLAQPKPAAARRAAAAETQIGPFLHIGGAILALVGLIALLQLLVSQFSFWKTAQKLWIVQFLGPVGVAAILLFFLGAFITLALSPVLIWETQSRKFL